MSAQLVAACVATVVGVVVVGVVVVGVVLVTVVSADAALPPPQDANTRLVASNNALQIEVFIERLLSVGDQIG